MYIELRRVSKKRYTRLTKSQYEYTNQFKERMNEIYLYGFGRSKNLNLEINYFAN